MAVIEAEAIGTEHLLRANRVASLAELGERSDAWLETRKRGIGGSDAASVAGVGEFKSAYEVYLDKTGQHPDGLSIPENEQMMWGRLLEEPVAQRTAEVHGLTLVKPQYLYQHADPSLYFMLANPDRIAIDPTRDDLGLVELKTCGPWMMDRWGEGPDEPATYALLQAVHYAAVLGLSWAVISVLIAGQIFRTYRIDINPKLVTMLIEYEADFWDRVERRDPPAPSGMDSDTELLNRLWDPTTLEGRKIVVGDEAVNIAHRYNVAHAAFKEAEEAKKAAGNELRLLLGDATEAVDAGGKTVCTWKPQSQGGIDFEPWVTEPWREFVAHCRISNTIRVLRPNKKL